MAPKIETVLSVAQRVAALEPQIAVGIEMVKAGILGVQALRAFFAQHPGTQVNGQADVEMMTAVMAECDRRIGKWQHATF